ncbi:unnamed protein product, partial [Iphiclides podalirius]
MGVCRVNIVSTTRGLDVANPDRNHFNARPPHVVEDQAIFHAQDHAVTTFLVRRTALITAHVRDPAADTHARCGIQANVALGFGRYTLLAAACACVVTLLHYTLRSVNVLRVETLRTAVIEKFSATNVYHNMSIFWASLFVTLFGNLQARQTNTDDNSSGFAEPSASSQSWYTAPPHTHAKTPIKVYKPREDPRLFYQSDDYLKEINSQNINYEVASIYPGREVVRFGEVDADVLAAPSIRRLRSRDDNRIDLQESQHCVKCPRDRTVLAKAGSDRVMLQSPRLSLCSGRKTPKSFHFGSLDGPKIGSLLEEGTYTIIGRIMHWNENLQICKFNVHVVTQRCRTPKSGMETFRRVEFAIGASDHRPQTTGELAAWEIRPERCQKDWLKAQDAESVVHLASGLTHELWPSVTVALGAVH